MRRERSKENDPHYQAFMIWMAAKTDADYRQMVMRGVLNRGEIAVECGFSKSVLAQNPRVNEALHVLEDDLRRRGVLPLPAEKREPDDNELPLRTPGANKSNAQRLKRLEEENASLKAQVDTYKRRLAQYGLLETALADTGRLPR